jgi:hypothetical protein
MKRDVQKAFYGSSRRDFSLAFVIIKVILKRREVTTSAADDMTLFPEDADLVCFAYGAMRQARETATNPHNSLIEF